MALIAMAVYDTPENNRGWMTAETLESIIQTVDFSRHRLFVVVNAATEKTVTAIAAAGRELGDRMEVIYTGENIGTARAINRAWLHRKAGENAVKMDNDVRINSRGISTSWVDIMEEAIFRDNEIGIIGLKRKDCWETTDNPKEFYRSSLIRLPHAPGQRWIDVEKVNHVMGTCQMYSAALLEKIGFLYQPGVYGWDDVLSAVRCKEAGFYSCFLPSIDIDHIDPGETDYQEWKQVAAYKDNAERQRLEAGYKSGAISVRYGPNGEQYNADNVKVRASTVGAQAHTAPTD